MNKNDQYMVRNSDHTDKDSDFTTADVNSNSIFLTYERDDVTEDNKTLAIKLNSELYLAITALIKHQPTIAEPGTWYKKMVEDKL